MRLAIRNGFSNEPGAALTLRTSSPLGRVSSYLYSFPVGANAVVSCGRMALPMVMTICAVSVGSRVVICIALPPNLVRSHSSSLPSAVIEMFSGETDSLTTSLLKSSSNIARPSRSILALGI